MPLDLGSSFRWCKSSQADQRGKLVTNVLIVLGLIVVTCAIGYLIVMGISCVIGLSDD